MSSETDNKSDAGVSYPYAPLAACIKLAQAVNDLGGGKAPVSKSLLASTLKEDEKSQTLQFKIGAAKVFGLIDGRSDFRLTPTSLKFFLPTSPNDKQIALIECLQHPRSFQYLIQRFDGSKLPDQELLANILHRDGGVPESWKGRIAASFVNSAKTAGVIDGDNFLRVKAVRHAQIAKSRDPSENESVNAILKDPPVSGGNPDDGDSGITRFKRVAGGLNPQSETFMITRSDDETGQPRTIYAEVPRQLSLSLWKLLESWVQSVKPKETKE